MFTGYPSTIGEFSQDQENYDENRNNMTWETWGWNHEKRSMNKEPALEKKMLLRHRNLRPAAEVKRFWEMVDNPRVDPDYIDRITDARKRWQGREQKDMKHAEKSKTTRKPKPHREKDRPGNGNSDLDKGGDDQPGNDGSDTDDEDSKNEPDDGLLANIIEAWKKIAGTSKLLRLEDGDEADSPDADNARTQARGDANLIPGENEESGQPSGAGQSDDHTSDRNKADPASDTNATTQTRGDRDPISDKNRESGQAGGAGQSGDQNSNRNKGKAKAVEDPENSQDDEGDADNEPDLDELQSSDDEDKNGTADFFENLSDEWQNQEAEEELALQQQKNRKRIDEIYSCLEEIKSTASAEFVEMIRNPASMQKTSPQQTSSPGLSSKRGRTFSEDDEITHQVKRLKSSVKLELPLRKRIIESRKPLRDDLTNWEHLSSTDVDTTIKRFRKTLEWENNRRDRVPDGSFIRAIQTNEQCEVDPYLPTNRIPTLTDWEFHHFLIFWAKEIRRINEVRAQRSQQDIDISESISTMSID